MNGKHDPVDSALNMLRSESWAAPEFKPEVENALMQKFEQQQKMRRFVRGPVAIAAVGVLAVGSVAFAASGAAQKLRQWFLNIELPNGETAKLIVQDGQPGEIRIENNDGTTTTVNALAEAVDGGDGHKARVVVTRVGPGEENQEISEVVRRHVADETTTDLSVLEGAEVIASFKDDAGRSVQVYSTAAEEGGMQAYVVTEGFGKQPERRILASPLLARLQPGTPATVSVSDAGMVEINFNGGPGEQATIRLVTDPAALEGMKDVNVNVDVDPATGQINMRVSRPAEEPK